MPKSYTINQVAANASSIAVYVAGLRMVPEEDYTLDGNTIIFQYNQSSQVYITVDGPTLMNERPIPVEIPDIKTLPKSRYKIKRRTKSNG